MSRIGACIGMAVVLSACGPSGTMTSAHRQALADSGRRIVRDFAEAMNSGDVKAPLRFFANRSTFHWAEDGRIAYPSYQSVVAVYDSLSGAVSQMDMNVQDPRVVPLAPGLLLVSATYLQRITDTAGTVTRLPGAFTFVAEHGDSGWRFVGGHSSTNRDLMRQTPARRR